MSEAGSEDTSRPDVSREDVLGVAHRAREAAAILATVPRVGKDYTLRRIADTLMSRAGSILAINAEDVDRAREAGMAEHMLDRLTLTEERVIAMVHGVHKIMALPDPVGEVVRGYTLPNGLELRQVRVPFGVVGIIYEGRPNVTVDAAALALKSGNAVLLRGSSSAYNTNAALVGAMQEALLGTSYVTEDAVQLVPGLSRDSVKHLMRARGLVDVLIPRGGASLINSVVEESTVPVIETGVGNCTVYIDAAAELNMALDILVNAKTQRPSVCNAAETFLVHAAVADEFLPRALEALRDKGVTVHGDDRVQRYGAEHGVEVVAATDEDFATEYLSLDISAAVVDTLEQAVWHIRRFGSGHTEAIVTTSQHAAKRFVALVDSAAVMVNASTRFTDGEEFGFGAEIGISTQKLHARGPMGLPELTSTKYVVIGEGHLKGP